MSSAVQPRLGERLVNAGLLPPGRLERGLELQKRHGGRLGEILVSEGMIGYFDLYRTIAQCQSIPFVDLLKQPPSPDLPRASDTQDYIRLRLIPWRNNNGVISIAVCDASEEVEWWIKRHYGSKTSMVMTSPIDIRRTVETMFGPSLENASCLSLWNSIPHASARETFTKGQKRIFIGLGVVALAATIRQPVLMALAIILFCQLAYSLTLLFKCWVFSASALAKPAPDWDEKLATLDPLQLPIYTVLIPMFRESDSLPGMLEVLQAIDYPAHKLDIKLVMESDDDETMDAALALNPCYHFEITRVPPGAIRTKPKACNYALRFARGEFVTVFDADDHPDPLQLKKAVYMFRSSPADVVCLQARLNYYNADTNLLTSFFSLEYTILFHFMLRGLEHLGIPIPLGGTSNHIACARLKEEGEWDPFNVTEDADLGTRFAARGYRTVMLDSTTMEEATSSTGPWIRQRSRWIKGYMQTWLVHMRHPLTLKKTLGWKGFIGFQFFVGLSTFTFLSAPLVWILSLLWIGAMLQLHNIHFPDWLACLTVTNMAFNLLSQWCFTANCLPLYQGKKKRIYTAAFLYPLYMVLHSIASYKALWQLIVKPHFWEKTTHGLAQPFALRNLKRRFRAPPAAH